MTMMHEADFTADQVGISHMLQGDAPAAGVNNSEFCHPNSKGADDFVETGPHLTIIVPKAML